MITEIYIAAYTKPKLDVSGIACILLTPEGETEWKLSIDAMTQNQADISALVYALNLVPSAEHVNVYSNSQLVVKCGNGEWRRHSNAELWNEYDSITANMSVELTWIRKNSKRLNTIAHRLAQAAAYQIAA